MSADTHSSPFGRWSYRLGRIAGIDIDVHATFLLLLAWVALTHLMQGHGARAAMSGVAFIVALFGIIVLHELGHALVAQHFGYRTRSITLLPIGGVARLDRIPEVPREELLVAIAGPLVNVAIAGILLAGLTMLGAARGPEAMRIVDGPLTALAAKLMWANVALAVFNLIPAFPMDGGRILRAGLALRMDHVRATDIAARVGQALALVFGFVGLFSNPFLVIIALFVWTGAKAEAAMAHVRASLEGVVAGSAMMTMFHALSPYEPVAAAVDALMAGYPGDFPVVDRGRVVGVLEREVVARAASSGDLDAAIGAVMRTDVVVADASEPLNEVLTRLQNSASRTVPVTHDGTLVGVVTLESLGQFVFLHDRTHRERRAHA